MCFCCVKKKAYAGIVVTASHNPKEYNGIKIYWKNGAQITRVREKKIEAFIRTCSNETPPEEQKDPIEVINEEIAEEYLSKVEKNSLRSLNNNVKLNIAYTALNGLGAKFIKRILQNSSFYDVKFVDKQCIPDGMFSHVKSPNPEDTESLEDLLILAKEIRADVAIANDPDVDRLSVAVPNENFSSYKILTGNEVGSILGSRILEKRKNENQKRLAISTVVSSRILKHIATKNNSSYVDATTGFPNIMNLAEKRNKFFNEKLIFAYEEALGYNIEDFVKDKDGICAAARFVDIVAELRQENKTIINELERIELEYGIFRDLQWSIFFENEHGRKMLTALMNNLRNNHKIGENFAGAIIEEKKDLINEIKGQKTNILIFKLSNEIRLTIRPSGTEPKLKFYTEIINKETKKEKLNEVSLELSEKLRKFKFELLSFLNIKK